MSHNTKLNVSICLPSLRPPNSISSVFFMLDRCVRIGSYSECTLCQNVFVVKVYTNNCKHTGTVYIIMILWSNLNQIIFRSRRHPGSGKIYNGQNDALCPFLTNFPWPRWEMARGQERCDRGESKITKDNRGAISDSSQHYTWSGPFASVDVMDVGLPWWNYIDPKMDYTKSSLRNSAPWVLTVLFHASYMNVENQVTNISL